MKKNKSAKLTIRKTFLISWITTIIAFFFTISAKNITANWPEYLLSLFLFNILLGLLSFFIIFFPRLIFPAKNKFHFKILLVIFVYLFFYIGIITVNGHGFIADQITTSNKITDVMNEGYAPKTFLTTPTPTETPTTTTKTLINADPIISCTSSHQNCIGQSINLKRSECASITCCQIGDTWKIYPSSEKCKEDQENYKKEKYPPCNLYGKTYNLTPEECASQQQYEAWLKSLGDSAQPLPNAPQQQEPTIDYSAQNQRNIELRSQCLKDVSVYCQQAETDVRRQCRALNLGDSSCQSKINSIIGQCNQLRSDCESKYPVN